MAGAPPTAAEQDALVSSFLEIAAGQTPHTATQFLQMTSWHLEEALQLFYIDGEAALAAHPTAAEVEEGFRFHPPPAAALEDGMLQGLGDEDDVCAPLPVRRETPYGDAPMVVCTSSSNVLFPWLFLRETWLLKVTRALMSSQVPRWLLIVLFLSFIEPLEMYFVHFSFNMESTLTDPAKYGCVCASLGETMPTDIRLVELWFAGTSEPKVDHSLMITDVRLVQVVHILLRHYLTKLRGTTTILICSFQNRGS